MRRPSLAPALPGNGGDYPGICWNAQHGHRAVPGLAEAVLPEGQCRAQGGFPSTFPRGISPTAHEATPPFPFAVKFRVVSLDKDLTPSNQKVRAGLGRGELTRAPCSVPASRGRGVGVTFALGNAAPASSARGAAPGAGMPCARDAAGSGGRKQRARVTQECAHASSQLGMQPW